ncbi:MAG: fumarylacetoacetase [Massilia sp.]|jgi:2-keto-4-pentenoate hydratase/2-oxohepta-3-ene-1,7-dioic acid hydratase in catechol pathway
MAATLESTLDPQARSWVESANDPATDFPIQNPPFGRFRREEGMDWRIGVAIGDQILDLKRARLIDSYDMNRLMACGREALRIAIFDGLLARSVKRAEWLGRDALVPMAGPADRPWRPTAASPSQARRDGWSARDIQAWEYQPLGPFLSKNFATTVSPWMVTPEALLPFRAPFERPDGDPAPLAYLDSPQNRAAGAFDITLEVRLQTESMREGRLPAERLMRSNYRDAYWTVAQMIAHHTVNGCNLCAGDLLGTGTLSGPKPEQGGSLLELSGGGKRSMRLTNGEERTWLEDGDTVILRGYCEREGYRRIGFGDCAGTVLPVRHAG